jgi:hypothetical protein
MTLTIDPLAARHVVVTLRIACSPARSTARLVEAEIGLSAVLRDILPNRRRARFDDSQVSNPRFRVHETRTFREIVFPPETVTCKVTRTGATAALLKALWPLVVSARFAVLVFAFGTT